MSPLSPALLVVTSVWAVRQDVMDHRIPNVLTGTLFILGLALRSWAEGWHGLGPALLGAVVGFAMLLPLYLRRATGAGDVKYLAAAGVLLGPWWAFLGGLYTLIAGGVLALGYLLASGLQAATAAPARTPWPIRQQLALQRMLDLRRHRFPYALAIALGVLLASWQRGDWASWEPLLNGGLP